MKQGQHDEQRAHGCKVIDGIYIGALKSPAEVAQAFSGRNELHPGVTRRWTLCGEVDQMMFETLHACGHPEQRNERLSVFGGESGVRYAVITHQAGSFQHRYLAPLFEPKVVAFVKAVAHGDALGYLLGGEGAQAAVWQSDFGIREFLPLMSMCTDTPKGLEAERVVEEFFESVLELKDPGRIPSLDGTRVRLASVSAIAPELLIKEINEWRGFQRVVSK